VECKLRSINFRRVSDSRRAFLPAFRVTGSAGDKPRSADDKPRSADDKPGSTWERWRQARERRRQAWEHLGAPATNLGAPATNLGAPVTTLGAPRITVEQSGKNIFFGNASGAPGNHSSTIFKTHVFSL